MSSVERSTKIEANLKFSDFCNLFSDRNVHFDKGSDSNTLVVTASAQIKPEDEISHILDYTIANIKQVIDKLKLSNSRGKDDISPAFDTIEIVEKMRERFRAVLKKDSSLGKKMDEINEYARELHVFKDPDKSILFQDLYKTSAVDLFKAPIADPFKFNEGPSVKILEIRAKINQTNLRADEKERELKIKHAQLGSDLDRKFNALIKTVDKTISCPLNQVELFGKLFKEIEKDTIKPKDQIKIIVKNDKEDSTTFTMHRLFLEKICETEQFKRVFLSRSGNASFENEFVVSGFPPQTVSRFIKLLYLQEVTDEMSIDEAVDLFKLASSMDVKSCIQSSLNIIKKICQGNNELQSRLLIALVASPHCEGILDAVLPSDPIDRGCILDNTSQEEYETVILRLTKMADGDPIKVAPFFAEGSEKAKELLIHLRKFSPKRFAESLAVPQNPVVIRDIFFADESFETLELNRFVPKGKWEDCEVYVKRNLSSNPVDRKANLMLLSRIYRELPNKENITLKELSTYTDSKAKMEIAIYDLVVGIQKEDKSQITRALDTLKALKTPEAYFQLGLYYHSKEKNNEEAIKQLTLGGKHLPCMLLLGRILASQEKFDDALKALRGAYDIESGDPDYTLYNCKLKYPFTAHYRGWYNAAIRKHHNGIKLTIQSADNGELRAIALLGIFTFFGHWFIGDKADKARGFKLIEKAARENIDMAQYALGCIIVDRLYDTPYDFSKGVLLLTEAAKTNDNAKLRLATILEKGEGGTPVDLKKAEELRKSVKSLDETILKRDPL